MMYDVCISYNHFIFDNSEEALVFAEQAKAHYYDKRDHDDVDVTITINADKEKAEMEE